MKKHLAYLIFVLALTILSFIGSKAFFLWRSGGLWLVYMIARGSSSLSMVDWIAGAGQPVAGFVATVLGGLASAMFFWTLWRARPQGSQT